MKCRLPKTEYEKGYEKGKRDGIHDVVTTMLMAAMLYMADKEGWREKRLSRLWEGMNRTFCSVAEGRWTFQDIQSVLKEEYNIHIDFEER